MIEIINEDERVFLKRLIIIKHMTDDDEIIIDESLFPYIYEEKEIKETTLDYIYNIFLKQNKELNDIKILALFYMFLNNFRKECVDTNLLERNADEIIDSLFNFTKKYRLKNKSLYFEKEDILTKTKNELIELVDELRSLKSLLNNNVTQNLIKIFLKYSKFSYSPKFPSYYSLTFFYLKKLLLNFVTDSTFEKLTDKDNDLKLLLMVDRHFKNKNIEDCQYHYSLVKLFCYSQKFKDILNNQSTNDDIDNSLALYEMYTLDEPIEIESKSKKIIKEAKQIINELLNNPDFIAEISTYYTNEQDRIINLIKEIDFSVEDEEFFSALDMIFNQKEN